MVSHKEYFSHSHWIQSFIVFFELSSTPYHNHDLWTDYHHSRSLYYRSLCQIKGLYSKWLCMYLFPGNPYIQSQCFNLLVAVTCSLDAFSFIFQLRKLWIGGDRVLCWVVYLHFWELSNFCFCRYLYFNLSFLKYCGLH